MIIYHTAQILETSAVICEWFLKNPLELSPRKQNTKDKVKYVYRENNGYLCSDNVWLPEFSQRYSSPHTEDFNLVKSREPGLHSENYQDTGSFSSVFLFLSTSNSTSKGPVRLVSNLLWRQKRPRTVFMIAYHQLVSYANSCRAKSKTCSARARLFQGMLIITVSHLSGIHFSL